MKKNKSDILLIAFLVLSIVFCFSIVSAKEQSDKQIGDKQIQVNDKEATSSDKNITGEEHRSTISNAVQGILGVADREKGVGEDIKVIAKAQDESKSTVANAIDKVKNRSKVKTFLIGTDYKNIGQLRSEMVKTTNQIDQLKKLMDKMTSEGNKTDIQKEIQALEQEQQKISDFINANESKFSLFGWFVKMFNK
jgi:hypothetical protein